MSDPTPHNRYRADTVLALLDSHAKLLGRPLLVRLNGESAGEVALRAYEAPFALLAHDTAADPRFTYANRTAQRLFEREWADFVGLPCRHSTEANARDAPQALLDRVLRQGYCEDYAGLRVTASGRRLRIANATVWNVLDPTCGERIGQATAFTHWTPYDH